MRHDPKRAPTRRGFAAAALVALVALGGAAAAAGFVALDLDARLAAAQDAAAGRVAAIDVEVRDGEPWTVVTLDVEQWWRRAGERPSGGAFVLDDAATSTAVFWGGRAPGVAPLQIAGMPAFTVGERVLWLLRAGDEGLAAPTVGVTQGVWREVDGVWRGDDGSVLGIDENGDLSLTGESATEGVLFEAIAAAFDRLEPTP
jgi:hypothetical protein